MNLKDKKVMIGLSGGINSMAVLCELAVSENRPADIYLFYAHFKEHSPDTLPFVLAGVDFAKKQFTNVHYQQTDNSVIDFFRESKMIPHPTVAPCTRLLKIIPLANFAMENGIQVDLIGYVKEEKRRVNNMIAKGANNLFLTKQFPIQHLSNEDCFQLVDNHIGWHPKIYDLRWNDEGFIKFVKERLHKLDEAIQKKLLKKIGTSERVFTHNNCLPCKNMQLDDYLAVEYFYPEHFTTSLQLSEELKKHWGRNEKDYWNSFGREDWEVNNEKQICDVCAAD